MYSDSPLSCACAGRWTTSGWPRHTDDKFVGRARCSTSVCGRRSTSELLHDYRAVRRTAIAPWRCAGFGRLTLSSIQHKSTNNTSDIVHLTISLFVQTELVLASPVMRHCGRCPLLSLRLYSNLAISVHTYIAPVGQCETETGSEHQTSSRSSNTFSCLII